jgi:hypothetical protein
MDAAQMLTAQEIVRQCEQLARVAEQREAPAAPPSPSGAAARRHLRLAEPMTEPIARVPEAAPEDLESTVEFPAVDDGPDVLTDRERGILAFERQWWKRDGAKERAIRELFDLSASRYYQVLNAILDKPEALQADPMLIKRLRKVRASRHRARAARRLGIELP